SLLHVEHADGLTLTGLIFDGVNRPLPARRGLVQGARGQGIRISDCELRNSGGDALHLSAAEGQITDNVFAGSSEAAIHSDDALGLLLGGNTISSYGHNWI